MPSPCAVVTTSSHVSAGSLPRVRTHRTSSSRISAAVPGIEPSPRARHSCRNSRNEIPSRVEPFRTSIGLNAWTWMSGTRAFTASRTPEVEVAGQARVQPALDADLGRAVVPRLLRAVGHLVQRQRVGLGVDLALGERAEPASRVADVREVDVPVDDVGHLVADGVPPQVVGDRAERLEGVALGLEQRQRASSRRGRRGGRPRPRGAPVGSRRRGARARRAAATPTPGSPPGSRRRRTRRARRRAGRPAAPWRTSARSSRGFHVTSGSCHATGSGARPSTARPSSAASRRPAPASSRRATGRAAARTRGRSRAARGACSRARPCRRARSLELRPRRLGVHVVERHRRDAAPVVDAGVDQPRVVRVGQVRRRLQVHARRRTGPARRRRRPGTRPRAARARGAWRSRPSPGSSGR